jgi:hypothetical protein
MGDTPMNKTQIEKLWKNYNPRVRATFAKWATQIREKGGTTDAEVFDMTDEEYGWSMLAQKPNGVPFDLTLYLTEEKVREGLEPGKANGVALHLSVCEEGGLIMADFAPCNYSPDLWLYTKEGFENRFRMFEKADFEVDLTA